jgi:phospholipid-binding lipoprotein MlaA
MSLPKFRALVAPHRFAALLVALGLVALLPACATRPPASDPEALAEFKENNDPAEPFNRAMFGVHNAIDRTVLRPVAVAYREVVPQLARESVSNFLANLRTPIILTNDLMQGEWKRAGDTASRFMINTTAGLGGFFDVAGKRFGIPAHTEDWGQTLAVWGMGSGPYLFLPVLGPSNPRDLAGFGLGIANDPFLWFGQGLAVVAATSTRSGMVVVDTRESLLDALDGVQKTSIDPYAVIRSAYQQRRLVEIANQPTGAATARAMSTGFGVGGGAPGTNP